MSAGGLVAHVSSAEAGSPPTSSTTASPGARTARDHARVDAGPGPSSSSSAMRLPSRMRADVAWRRGGTRHYRRSVQPIPQSHQGRACGDAKHSVRAARDSRADHAVHAALLVRRRRDRRARHLHRAGRVASSASGRNCPQHRPVVAVEAASVHPFEGQRRVRTGYARQVHGRPLRLTGTSRMVTLHVAATRLELMPTARHHDVHVQRAGITAAREEHGQPLKSNGSRWERTRSTAGRPPWRAPWSDRRNGTGWCRRQKRIVDASQKWLAGSNMKPAWTITTVQVPPTAAGRSRTRHCGEEYHRRRSCKSD